MTGPLVTYGLVALWLAAVRGYEAKAACDTLTTPWPVDREDIAWMVVNLVACNFLATTAMLIFTVPLL